MGLLALEEEDLEGGTTEKDFGFAEGAGLEEEDETVFFSSDIYLRER